MPFLSRHMGSTPGEGLSGMQVNPLVPSRSIFIPPFSSIAMMVASFATASGAADIALLIMSASVVGGGTGPVFIGIGDSAVVVAAGVGAAAFCSAGGALHALTAADRANTHMTRVDIE